MHLVASIAFVFVGAIFLVPLAAASGLWVWARWLARQNSAPPLASYTGYGIAVVAALPIVAGVASGFHSALGPISGVTLDPSQKARILAEGISEAMNCSVFGFLVAALGGLWLGFCTWRWRRRAPWREAEAGHARRTLRSCRQTRYRSATSVACVVPA
jgi:hypothetical protein